MPKQCFDLKDFVQNKLINRAKKVIIVHTKNKTTGKRIVKIKSRTPSYLYTFVCDENKARKIESAIPAGIEKEIIKGGKRRTNDANLSKDSHVRGIALTSEGEARWIELQHFLSFGRLQALGATVASLKAALSHSNTLEVQDESVRRRTPIKLQSQEASDASTVWLGNLPLAFLEEVAGKLEVPGGSSATHTALADLLSPFGHVVHVSVPRFSDTRKFKGFAFVQFEEESSVAKAVEAFGDMTWEAVIEARCALEPTLFPKDVSNFQKRNQLGRGFKVKSMPEFRKHVSHTKECTLPVRKPNHKRAKCDEEGAPRPYRGGRVVFRLTNLTPPVSEVSIRSLFSQFTTLAYVDLVGPSATEGYIRVYTAQQADQLEKFVTRYLTSDFLLLGGAPCGLERLSEEDERKYRQ